MNTQRLNNRDSLKKQAYLNLIGRVGAFVIALFTPIFLVRLLLPEEYGLYRTVLVLSTTISPIVEFNFSNSLFYFYTQEKTKEGTSKLLTNVFVVSLGFTFVFFLLALLLKEIIVAEISGIEDLDLYYYPIVFHIIFTVISAPLDRLFIVEGNGINAMYYYIANQFLRVVLMFGALLLLNSVISLVWSLVLFVFLKAIFLILYLAKNYDIHLFRYSKTVLKKQFSYVFPLGLGLVLSSFGKRADKLILLMYFSSVDFAIYSVGSYGIPLLSMLYLSVGNVILPKLSENSPDKRKNYNSYLLWKKMILLNAIVTIPVFVFFQIVAYDFLTLLFTSEYKESVIVFRLSIFSVLFQMLGHGFILRGYGETKFILFARTLKLILSLLLGFILIKNFGVFGAIFTYISAYGINAILQLYKSSIVLGLKKITFIPWKDFFIIFLLTLVGAVLIYLLSFFTLPKIVFLILSGLLFFGIYFVILKKTKYYDLLPVSDISVRVRIIVNKLEMLKNKFSRTNYF